MQVMLDDKLVTDFTTDKARALLAYLAVGADRPHRRDVLAGLLWPNQSQERARRNLRQALSFLRQALGDGEGADEGRAPFLLVDRNTIQFNRQSDHWLDVAELVALLEACQSHRHRRLETCLPCMRRLERAADLYEGQFLEQFSLSDSGGFEEWALLQRESFHRRVAEALVHLASHYERRGEHDKAREYAWRQVMLEPWREEAYRQIMRLLALDGQRSAALAEYEACRRALAGELGVEPTAETVTLYEQIRSGESLQREAPPHNLPSPPTPFVDRKEELADLSEMLADPDCRLVTLVGPGGIGKTRLALEVAAAQAGAFADGIHFVSFGAVGSGEQLVATLADALGFPLHDHNTEQQLLSYLHGKELLLVLDNLEHVVSAGAILSRACALAPKTVLLVTSRERLNLREEWVYEVRGLAYPEDRVEGAGHLFGAIDLFEQCARRANRYFSLEESEVPYVSRICQLVEGMPLGIELAAAWTTIHSCEEIAGEIERNLDILTTRLSNVPERHQSVRASFEHSWQLLAEQEQQLLARLSVFRGGFHKDAAAVVAGARSPTLAALLDKSLIRRISADRYDMHGLLGQFSMEKLSSSSEEREQAFWQYVCHFTAFLEQQQDALKLAKQKQDFGPMSVEIENARYAWQAAVTRGWASETDRMLNSLYHFYSVQCRFQEGMQVLSQAIDRWRHDRKERRLFSRALSRFGALCYHLGHLKRARACLNLALKISEGLGIEGEQVFCLVHLASVARNRGQYEETEQLANRSLALSKECAHDWGISFSLFLLGLVQYRKGILDQAEVLLSASLSAARESGNQRRVIAPLNVLGDIACHRGDYVEAQRMFEECLRLSEALGDQFNVAVQYNNLGTVFHVSEEYAQASHFYEQSLEICREIGDRSGQAVALSNLGEIAFALGEYREAQAFYAEGLSIGREIQDPWTVVNCLNNLGEIGCALDDRDSARGCFVEALEMAAEAQIVPLLLKVLVNLAECLARHDQRDRAAELLALARQHPASEQTTQEKASQLLDELGLVLPDGEPRPLDEVIEETLASISATSQAAP
jgi:predicted ATPase/DNA-binding SARP family transcriptional activator/Tfp pilus assembly protein PilF